MPNPIDYIIGAGDGISKVAQAYDDRLPADPNQVALMRHAQDVINGRLSPQEAALAYHQSVQTPGWSAADAAPYAVPNPGGMTIQNPAFPGAAPTQQPGRALSGEHSVPGAMQGGLSGEGGAMGVAPQVQAAQQPTPTPQQASADGYGVGLSGQGVPPVSMNFTSMTRGQARELQPQLERMASAKFSSNALQDQIALERERQKGREKIVDKKQDGREALAAFNADEKLKQLDVENDAKAVRLATALENSNNQLDKRLYVELLKLKSAMDRLDKALENARTITGMRNGSDERVAALRVTANEALGRLNAYGKIIGSINYDEGNEIGNVAAQVYDGYRKRISDLKYEAALQNVNNIAASDTPVKTGGGTTKIETDNKSNKTGGSGKKQNGSTGPTAEDLSKMFGG